eukprot:CAMPEP_0172473640 /NCGR_PEP_ID=MMETSP1065-20121228/68957_1 /TAXON_ID=265537 /ORGANISM="Amphiprora paludosa, Strain CCMP125" /LENGTH=380 /DNA_ID=CAMNT_0013231815 /DNA_START=79 /DNA_END=1221 /DNA_ORIENTATION=-
MTTLSQWSTITTALVLCLLVSTKTTPSFAFQIPLSGITQPTDNRNFALLGKARRGKLASLVDTDDVAAAAASTRRTTRKARGGQGKTVQSGAGGESISPALAQWASQGASSSVVAPISETTANDDDEPVASLESLDQPNSKKNKASNKPSIRQQAMAKRDEKVGALVLQLQEVLGSDAKDTDIGDILAPIRQLVALPLATEQFRTLTAGTKETNDYRLAWVGSDDSVSHVGTGLHKVPLARLQEVFLQMPGRNQLQLSEVIRILGPFPNVKNTLEGSCTTGKTSGSDDDSEVAEWKITWETMTDGTGKELLAGKQENVQKLSLQVHFCTSQVLVAAVPPNLENPSERPKKDALFEENGKNLLVFVKEEDIDAKLESLRVA